MGIGCIGKCDASVRDCPKHHPPVFNPPTQWLLEILYPSPNDRQFTQWQKLNDVLREEGVSLSLLRPVRAHDGEGQIETTEPNLPVRGALGLPLGFRMASTEIAPREFRHLAEEIRRVLNDRAEELAPVMGQELATLQKLAERLIEIGRCAEGRCEASLAISVYYGW